jgi:uncharacterized phage protein (TIGR01671 family)
MKINVGDIVKSDRFASMREIKFRAWVKQDKKMIYDIHVGWGRHEYEDCFSDYLNNERYVVMQYTGMKDKKGREIYEGDVVKSDDYLEDIFGVAEYNDEDVGSCGCCYPSFKGTGFVIRIIGCKDKYFGADEIEKCEVVGNIYEG